MKKMANEVLNQSSSTSDQSAQAYKVQPDWLGKLCTHIHAHVDDTMNLQDLSAIVNLTPRALQYAFKEHLNTTPMRWVREQKLEQVHQTLKTHAPTLTVTKAAVASGFTNLGIFARYYNEQYGEKPSQTLRVRR